MQFYGHLNDQRIPLSARHSRCNQSVPISKWAVVRTGLNKKRSLFVRNHDNLLNNMNKNDNNNTDDNSNNSMLATAPTGAVSTVSNDIQL